ncbi:hypothetical protein, partial [Escherichia coli]|uniref:hypothetical protein n=1 Tax=Escherichia coli TaxID=562 RepID=UPI001C585547
FFNTLAVGVPEPDQLTALMGQVSLAGRRSVPSGLFSVNMLDMTAEHLGALEEEVLPEDRRRFRAYFSAVPLGLGLTKGV